MRRRRWLQQVAVWLCVAALVVAMLPPYRAAHGEATVSPHRVPNSAG